MTSVEILIVIAAFAVGLIAWLVVLGMRHLLVAEHKGKNSFELVVLSNNHNLRNTIRSDR